MSPEEYESHGCGDPHNQRRDAGRGQQQVTDAGPGRGRQRQEQGLESRGPMLVDTEAAEKIDNRGGQHQGQKTHVPAGIKDVAGRQQQE